MIDVVVCFCFALTCQHIVNDYADILTPRGVFKHSLRELDDGTTLTVELDAPPEQVETFKERLPKALERVKVLAEKKE